MSLKPSSSPESLCSTKKGTAVPSKSISVAYGWLHESSANWASHIFCMNSQTCLHLPITFSGFSPISCHLTFCHQASKLKFCLCRKLCKQSLTMPWNSLPKSHPRVWRAKLFFNISQVDVAVCGAVL